MLHATTIGLPLNRHVTIHLQMAGVKDCDAAATIGRLLTLIRDWLRKKGLATAFAWVRENGAKKGSHVHILIHVPKAASWDGWRMRRWLKLVTGEPYRRGVVKTRTIGGGVNAAETVPEHYAVNLSEVVGYVLKGSSPETARALGLVRLKDGGTIIGKRAGWSENVGKAARAASGNVG